ncbi:MAG: hypothetical protein EGQ26_06565 [Clostridiales bacterium]|nr:hypothetical protein [Clostridiales bacterium]
MSMGEFLKALEAGLAGSADKEAILEYYQEMIEDRVEDGMDEADAVAQLGSVEEILSRCVQGLTVTKPVPPTGISRVEIREKEFDVTIVPTSEQTYRVEATPEGFHDCTLENGVLRILRNKLTEKRSWFFAPDEKLTLYLPEGVYEGLDVTTASGNIAIRQSFGTVHVTGASSDVTVEGSFPGKVAVQTASGNVSLQGTFEDTAEVQTSSGDQAFRGKFRSGRLKSVSGDLELSRASFEEKLEIETVSGDGELTDVLTGSLRVRAVSGDMRMERVCVEALVLETKSGDLELEQTLSKGDFRCRTVSGDVRLEACDGLRMTLTTVSGDISGNVRSPKHFTGHTVSGDMDLPDTTGEGTCDISTVSGSAELEVQA